MASNTILLPDKNSFNWLILNLLGHDFYHDYNNIVTRVEAIEQDIIIELDLLIDNYHTLKQANDSPADLLAALESEKGQPYAVMIGGGGSDSNEASSQGGEQKNNSGSAEDAEVYEELLADSQKKISGKVITVENSYLQKQTEEKDDGPATEMYRSSVIKNINYESQVLSLKMQHLLSKVKYCSLQIHNGKDRDSIPMRSTPDSIIEEDGDKVLEKIIYKTITKGQYAEFLSRNWLPLVEISSLPYLDLESEEHEEDYAFPTYGAIITYAQEQILKRIGEIKDKAVDKIGLLSLAPIFKVVIETSLVYEKNETSLKDTEKNAVKTMLEKQINDMLNIGSEDSPYSRNKNGSIDIFRNSYGPINNAYISGYLRAIFGEAKVSFANLNQQLIIAHEQTKTYIDSLIEGDARPERELQSREEIKKQLNELIPKRLRELQTSGAPAYRTKARKEKYAAFIKLLMDPERGVPPEISEESTVPVLKAFEKFVLKLYHPDKIGNSKKTSNYFYGEDIKKDRGKGDPLRVWLINLFDPTNKRLTLGQILPKPDRELGRQIWDSFGGPRGLRSKLNILSGGKYLSGGGFLREFGEKDQQRSVLQHLNDILIRSLLIVILKKTDSIETREVDANFPIFPIQLTANKSKIEEYRFNRPKLERIFPEDLALTKEWRQANAISGAEEGLRSPLWPDGSIIWGNIYGVFSPVSREPPLKLEVRKRIARILFLNVERLVLYYQLVTGSPSIAEIPDSTVISKKYLLQALGFIVDTSKQSYHTCEKRGFSTIGFFNANAEAGKSVETKARRQGKGGGIGVTFRPISDEKFGTMEEMKEKCILERQKYFGWLFNDDLIRLEDLEAKKMEAVPNSKEEKKFTKEINSFIGEPPAWFRAATPDEQIQLAYNEIVRKLLPEYILTAGTQQKELYKHLQTEVAFPRPVECGNVDCSEEKAIGKMTDFPAIKSSYIINNASQIYATLDKVDQPRWQFYNLDGMQVRYAQYCPVSSIADSMPYCSLPTKGNTETQKRLVFNPMDITVTYPGAAEYDRYRFVMKPSEFTDLIDFDARTNYTKRGSLLKSLSAVYKIYGSSGAKRKAAYTKYNEIAEDIRNSYPMDATHIDGENNELKFDNKTAFKDYIKALEESMEIDRGRLFKVRFTAEILSDGITLCDCNREDGKVTSLEGEGPFQAAATYLSILQETNNILLGLSADDGGEENSQSSSSSPTANLFKIFQDNIKKILNMTIRKSMGDYSQELATVSKFSGTPTEDGNALATYNAANTYIITSESIKEVYPISQSYDEDGNSLRLFVANDRPSAYRGIFFITQALDGSFNSKSMGGYYKSGIIGKGRVRTAENDAETLGKSFIVKAPMVIPSQLPQYYAEKYVGNTRDPRKDSKQENELETDEGKKIYGFNIDDYMRWQEQQYKLYDELVDDGAGGLRPAPLKPKTSGGDQLNFEGIPMAGSNSSSDNNSNNSNNNNNNAQSGASESAEKITSPEVFKERDYKMFFGGSRRHTRKNFKRISRNKTLKN